MLLLLLLKVMLLKLLVDLLEICLLCSLLLNLLIHLKRCHKTGHQVSNFHLCYGFKHSKEVRRILPVEVFAVVVGFVG